jgi:hypothetical protein
MMNKILLVYYYADELPVQGTHRLKQLITIECPPGIYEREYQAIAIIWKMRNKITSPGLLGPNAAHNVRAMNRK